ncbi:ribosomal protein S18 acetylase RimI-like enzyme [Alteromonadaceae bacterium 2753L.S.0a.02]|nr:ribosomal protein S18 acetylase RimI-like enzyme [Alteromonadaceae bacterium 2753L.S.0a.02]
MKIREAFPDDAQAISNIHTESWRETYQNALSFEYLSDIVPFERQKVWIDRLQNPKMNQHVLVAEIDERIVGFVCIYSDENPKWGSYLDNLHVIKAHQSKGIGKTLLTQAMKWSAIQIPDKGMCLLVNQDNTNAQRFYKSFGAKNAEEGVWNAPDGSAVPTYWFVWDSTDLQAQYG